MRLSGETITNEGSDGGDYMLELRQYQEESLEALRSKMRAGCRKILLVAPTGSGKTAIFCQILKSTVAKGNRGVMVVRGRSLVEQASNRLSMYGIQHGVVMANQRRASEAAAVQICSIDTVFKRRLTPPADVVIIDEAHLAATRAYAWFLERYSHALIIGVTATPYNKRGLRAVADDFVESATMRQLINEGYLAPLKYYCPPAIDITGVKRDANGDFNIGQLFAAADKPKIYGSLINSYETLLRGKRAIAYGVNVEHSKAMADNFSAAKIPAIHVDANTSLKERSDIIKKLVQRKISIITSVGTMTTGIDIPELEALIIARPTASLNLHLQILGRVTRTAQGKLCGIVCDHAGNVMRHGLAESERTIMLDGYPKTPKNPPSELVTCKCYAVWSRADYPTLVCPACGLLNIADHNHKTRTIEYSDAQLAELSVSELREIEILNAYREMEVLRKLKRSRDGKAYHYHWTFHQLITKFGRSLVLKTFPQARHVKWR